jgi:hypothetical protein
MKWKSFLHSVGEIYIVVTWLFSEFSGARIFVDERKATIYLLGSDVLMYCVMLRRAQP